MIDTLFIFAAGLGKRMLNLTEFTPKPLLKINNKSFLNYAIEFALTYPFKHIIINTHYKAEQIEEAIKYYQNLYPDLPKITLLYEPILLETGGAIKNAVAKLNLTRPIFTLNSDIIMKSEINIFNFMISHWQSKMDYLLLLCDYSKAIGYKGIGDFELSKTNHLLKPSGLPFYKYIYTGISILNPRLIDNEKKEIFSLSQYFLSNNSYGIAGNNYKWYTSNSPQELLLIENSLKILN